MRAAAWVLFGAGCCRPPCLCPALENFSPYTLCLQVWSRVCSFESCLDIGHARVRMLCVNQSQAPHGRGRGGGTWETISGVHQGPVELQLAHESQLGAERPSYCDLSARNSPPRQTHDKGQA